MFFDIECGKNSCGPSTLTLRLKSIDSHCNSYFMNPRNVTFLPSRFSPIIVYCSQYIICCHDDLRYNRVALDALLCYFIRFSPSSSTLVIEQTFLVFHHHSLSFVFSINFLSLTSFFSLSDFFHSFT